jgi:hypothetical protein
MFKYVVALHHEEGHPVFVSIYLAVHITGDGTADFCSTVALLVLRTGSLL